MFSRIAQVPPYHVVPDTPYTKMAIVVVPGEGGSTWLERTCAERQQIFRCGELFATEKLIKTGSYLIDGEESSEIFNSL